MGFEFGFGSGTQKFGFTPGTVSGFRVPPNYITITCIAIVDWINIPSENKSMHHWSNKILELGIQNIDNNIIHNSLEEYEKITTDWNWKIIYLKKYIEKSEFCVENEKTAMLMYALNFARVPGQFKYQIRTILALSINSHLNSGRSERPSPPRIEIF